MNDLIIKNKSAKVRIGEQNKEINDLINKNKVLKDNIEAQSKKIKHFKNENKLIEKIEIKMNNLENENKLLNEKIEKQINELKNEKKLLNEKIEVQNKENNNLKNENKSLNEKIEKQTNKLKIEKKLLNETIEVQSKEINILKNENKLLNEKIEEQKKECKYPRIITDIMKSNEKFLIFSEIEKRMNKKIKQIKKLYQATIDGGDSINFHKKCDNISNTLILIKSEGKRRFGGFTPIAWKSEEDYKLIKDPENKTFIF